MKPLSYPSLELFPPAASADPRRKYLAANTGIMYYIPAPPLSPNYIELPTAAQVPLNPMIGTSQRKPVYPNQTAL